MTTPFTGGCICGAIRYQCSAEPMMTANCHCRSCQRASGGAFVTILAVPRDAVKITGEAKYYDVEADSGHTASRGFCPDCGARLFGKPTAMPEMMGINASSLDEPHRFRPGMDIFTERAQPWVCMDPDLPKFPGMPEQPG